MSTIKITDIEPLWSELSDKDTAVLSGGLCAEGEYSFYVSDLGLQACADFEDGTVQIIGVGFPAHKWLTNLL